MRVDQQMDYVLVEMKARILRWSWVGWVWLTFVLFAIAILTIAIVKNEFRMTNAVISLGFLGVLITVGSAIANVREDQNDSLMPSWLMRLVYSFCFVTILVVAISYSAARSVSELPIVIAGATAAFAVGALLGFIFGVPRALSGTGRTSAVGSEPAYAPNTNLERVSEWLTGIIIGLTLVQFDAIRRHFVLSATEFADSLGHVHIFFSSALLIFFSAAGFLLAYLWTRLRLLSDLTRADDVLRREPEYLEGLMNAFLYTSPPRGFQRAIALGLEYCKRFGTPNSRVFLYLTCAYGQQHKYLSAFDARGQKAEIGVSTGEAKKLALDAIDECLDHDPSLLKLLKSLWDPDDDELADNDLESLYEDDDAKKLFKKYQDKADAEKKRQEKPD
jgi:hypothetical protein